MIILGLLFALAIGLSVAWGWALVFGTHGPWDNFFWFFMVIFLFSWGAGSWITPFGPTGWGISWVPILFMGVLMALSLTAATPRSRRRRARPGSEKSDAALAREEAREDATFDGFFWVLILVLVGFALMNYARPAL